MDPNGTREWEQVSSGDEDDRGDSLLVDAYGCTPPGTMNSLNESHGSSGDDEADDDSPPDGKIHQRIVLRDDLNEEEQQASGTSAGTNGGDAKDNGSPSDVKIHQRIILRDDLNQNVTTGKKSRDDEDQTTDSRSNDSSSSDETDFEDYDVTIPSTALGKNRKRRTDDEASNSATPIKKMFKKN